MDAARPSENRPISTRCCVVGGGPAGMMLGYLLGRAGVDTIVLEKHADFFRDFRGDTVHPSTLQVMDELGLIDDFLKVPHDKLQKLDNCYGRTRLRVADISRTGVKYPFIAFMPQWDFLNFLRDKGRRFPSLKVMMSTEATGLIHDGDRVAGVRARDANGAIEIRAELTVACDGRHSIIRPSAGLKIEEIGAPMDVLWFRAGKSAETESVLARVEAGKMIVTLDRGTYWQCAYAITKGQYDAVRAKGLESFRSDVVSLAPILKPGIADVKSWDDIKLLTVAVNRLKRWTRPGLLCIGDAAHAMSPVGGVGVNIAVQDAVATANILAARLASGGTVSEDDLAAVQRRREFPMRMTQAMQVFVQNSMIRAALKPGSGPLKPPLVARIINAVPWLQGLTAKFIAVGVRPEHVHSPEA
ncbi:MAG: monooxygenase, FAD-binding protein [Nitrobacter sp.]|uniref:FAD-dependent oxidoreductase n=1 Tax=Nitrobacter sp. TaxID=29420 RepID=UPI00387DF06D